VFVASEMVWMAGSGPAMTEEGAARWTPVMTEEGGVAPSDLTVGYEARRP
jgi:hypothetical protein